MNTTSLIIASLLILVPISISYKEGLGLEKDIVVSMIRAIIQLIIVGYVLEEMFQLKNAIVTLVIVIIMIFNATINTRKRGGNIERVMTISFLSIFVGVSIILTVLVISGAIKFVANEVIPIAGMIINNAMIAIGLSYRNLNTAFRVRRAEIEAKLSLGADVKEASKSVIKESIKLAIIPTIDSAKTLGIVSLPGMMSGLILAGVSPLEAIKFQIMVTFMIVSSSAIAAMISTYFGYRYFFNDRKQLKLLQEIG